MPAGWSFSNVNLASVPVFVGALLGAMLTYLFSSLAIKAVGRTAQTVIEDVRAQFAENPGIRALYERARGVAADIGIDLPKQHRGGGSDGNFTAALGVPTLDGLGCLGGGAHASHEHILWQHLAPRAALLAGLLETLD